MAVDPRVLVARAPRARKRQSSTCLACAHHARRAESVSVLQLRTQVLDLACHRVAGRERTELRSVDRIRRRRLGPGHRTPGRLRPPRRARVGSNGLTLCRWSATRQRSDMRESKPWIAPPLEQTPSVQRLRARQGRDLTDRTRRVAPDGLAEGLVKPRRRFDERPKAKGRHRRAGAGRAIGGAWAIASPTACRATLERPAADQRDRCRSGRAGQRVAKPAAGRRDPVAS
jgi:hypothetical protein